MPGQGAGPEGFSNFSGFPGGGGHTFTFTSGPGGSFGGSSGGGFAPSDPQKIFEQMFGSGGLFGSMGGGGGMGGMPGIRGRTGSMFDSDDDAMDGSFGGFSQAGHPGSFQSSTRRQRPSSAPSQPSEITRPLKVSLQDLYSGTVKHLKVGRRLLTGSTEDKVLDIQIHPGWKSGTKIRFAGAGNEQPNRESQDLVFVVEEKPHETYSREGNDLICRVPIPLVEALTGVPGGKKIVELLDGRRLQVPVPSGVIKPGQETTIHGEGMPIRKEGSVKNKGDLIVKWDVTFPERLTPAQQAGLKKVLG